MRVPSLHCGLVWGRADTGAGGEGQSSLGKQGSCEEGQGIGTGLTAQAGSRVGEQ